MIIEQIWTANGGRNFFYLVACSDTGETLAIDPIDPITMPAGTEAVYTMMAGECFVGKSGSGQYDLLHCVTQNEIGNTP